MRLTAVYSYMKWNAEAPTSLSKQTIRVAVSVQEQGRWENKNDEWTGEGRCSVWREWRQRHPAGGSCRIQCNLDKGRRQGFPLDQSGLSFVLNLSGPTNVLTSTPSPTYTAVCTPPTLSTLTAATRLCLSELSDDMCFSNNISTEGSTVDKKDSRVSGNDYLQFVRRFYITEWNRKSNAA